MRLLKIVIFVVLSMFITAKGQVDNYHFYRAHEAWEVGIDMGINSFYGDMDDNSNKFFPATPFQASFYKNRNFIFGAYFGKRITPFWTAAFAFKLGDVSGSHHNYNYAFRSYWNNEAVISHTLDILSMCNLQTNWSLYPKVGFGIYGYRTKSWNTLTDEIIDNTPYRYAFTIPFGLGVSYRVLPELRVYFETGATWVSGDQLDNYPSDRKNFEGTWNTVIGVSYQFDFPPLRAKSNPRSNTANDALKDDGVTKKYKKKRWRSNLGSGKPRYSKTSAMKRH